MKYNSSSQGISIINKGKDGYISNGQEHPKIKKNYSKSNINDYESCWNSKTIIKIYKKILNTDYNTLDLSLEQTDIINSYLVQSLMETSYTRQIVSDFSELDECYFRGGLL